jgi:hypothetical protein
MSASTAFDTWTEPELRAFLDQRGEDYDEGAGKTALIAAAKECEANTGPATRPFSKTEAGTEAAAAGTEGDDEIDPLDAFMAEMAELETAKPVAVEEPSRKLARQAEGLDDEDHLTDFLAARKRGTVANVTLAPIGDGYGSDAEVYATADALDGAQGDGAGRGQDESQGRRAIEPLAALNHGTVAYEDFCKDFYEEDPTVTALDNAQVAQQRKALGIRVSGYKVPKPVAAFGQCGFDAPLVQAIVKAGYTAPTPIQAQALPAVLSGRDVLVRCYCTMMFIIRAVCRDKFLEQAQFLTVRLFYWILYVHNCRA